jgi:hypothetical protein
LYFVISNLSRVDDPQHRAIDPRSAANGCQLLCMRRASLIGEAIFKSEARNIHGIAAFACPMGVRTLMTEQREISHA